jgi:hypothetical protein
MIGESVLVRHDAEIRVVIECGLSLHDSPCSDSIVEARLLDTHLAVSGSFMHGKVSGMDSGVRVKARYSLVHPERDTLVDGQLCDCRYCSEGTGNPPLVTPSIEDVVVAFAKGVQEAEGDVGATYDDDPDSLLSRSYDFGRTIGRERLGIE